MTDSDVETGLDAYIGNRRLRMDLELATATRGRVQLVEYKLLSIKMYFCNMLQKYSYHIG
jgi:hypothetical protein